MTNRSVTPEPEPRQEFDTPTKSSFFGRYDEARRIAQMETRKFNERAWFRTQPIKRETGLKWLKQRAALGNSAYHRTRKFSNRIGRPELNPPALIRSSVDPAKNPYRFKRLPVQMQKLGIRGCRRTFMRALKKHTKGGKVYKAAYVKKRMRKANREARKDYTARILAGPRPRAHSKWEIYYDEFHYNTGEDIRPTVLRESGSDNRYDSRNLAEYLEREPASLHFAGWVSYAYKIRRLIQYNDEGVRVEKPQNPRTRPRGKKGESEEDLARRIREWEAKDPHEVVIIPKRNAMTQEYFCETILPHLIDAYWYHKRTWPGPWKLLMDSDPSHGMKKYGRVQEMLEAAGVEMEEHPAQSPDLSAAEPAWNILKPRVRSDPTWETDEECIEAVHREWDKIDQRSIRGRIREMPWRLEQIRDVTDGRMVRSRKW